MSDNELKPCPFCGEKPSHENWKEFTRTVWYDEDGNEHAEEYDCHSIECCGFKCDHPEQWNTRPIEDGLQSELAKAKGEIEDYVRQINSLHAETQKQEQRIKELEEAFEKIAKGCYEYPKPPKKKGFTYGDGARFCCECSFCGCPCYDAEKALQEKE